MSGLNKHTPDSAPRAAVFSGLVLALAATIGAETTILASGGLRATRQAGVAVKSIASPNPIYQANGILAMAGASVLVLAWLQRQSSRYIVAIFPPAEARRCVIAGHPPHRIRKHSISQHIGGLHGP